MVSSVTYGCSDDYIGLALPVCISDMFHVRDAPYFQQRASPPSEERKCFLFGDGDGEKRFTDEGVIFVTSFVYVIFFKETYWLMAPR